MRHNYCSLKRDSRCEIDLADMYTLKLGGLNPLNRVEIDIVYAPMSVNISH